MKTFLLILWLSCLTGGGWMGYRAWDILSTRNIDAAGVVVYYIGLTLILFILSGVFFLIWR